MSKLLTFLNLATLNFFIVVSSFVIQSETLTHSYTPDTIPDYYQMDTAFGGFPDGGKMYCGPVAISNSLIHLTGNKIFTNTIDKNKRKENQHSLICMLASPRYIATGPNGSDPSNICKGVQNFLSDNGIKNDFLYYYGWRYVPFRFRKGLIPDFTIIRKTLNKPGTAIWLNFGWYTFNNNDNHYIRTGGHWVTLIGLNKTPKLGIIIHDPETRNEGNDTIAIELVEKGKLSGNFPVLPFAHSGYYQFYNSNNQYGIIDGVVILKIKQGFY